MISRDRLKLYVFAFVFVIQTVVFRNCSARSRARAFQRLRLIKEGKKLPDRNKPPSGPGSGLYREKYEHTLIISPGKGGHNCVFLN